MVENENRGNSTDGSHYSLLRLLQVLTEINTQQHSLHLWRKGTLWSQLLPMSLCAGDVLPLSQPQSEGKKLPLGRKIFSS